MHLNHLLTVPIPTTNTFQWALVHVVQSTTQNDHIPFPSHFDHNIQHNKNKNNQFNEAILNNKQDRFLYTPNRCNIKDLEKLN